MASRRKGLAREESSVILADDQVAELKEAFELFDTSRSGAIKKDTLKNVLKQYGKEMLLFFCFLVQ
jgi:Ca2+-binding EF-hand superfamily protein